VTALIAEKLARAARMDADFAYVAGLLRDIGRLALLVKYPEPYSNILAVSGEQQFDLLLLERELFDIDHCEAGSWLMEQLPFPPDLADIIAHHHDKLDYESFHMLNLIQCADRLADALGFSVLAGLPTPPAPAPPVEEVLALLPEAARARLGDDYDQWRADLTARLHDWH
jgi:putative nucleotidyltransferase with HDIG domain